MSFNIRYATASDGENVWDRRKDFLAETIHGFNPDLLGTQEVLARQRDDLKGRLPGYAMVAAGRDDGRDQGEMMAVYFRADRFEKLDSGHFWLSETPQTAGSKSWDSSLPRMVTWVKLRDRRAAEGSPPIAFFNTHFDHRGRRARLEAARILRDQVNSLGQGCRVVVTGDFNSDEGSEPYATVFGAGKPGSRPLRDSFRTVHPTRMPGEGTTTDFRAGASSGARIDWIGVSDGWTITSAEILRAERDGRTPSDHHAVTATLRAGQP